MVKINGMKDLQGNSNDRNSASMESEADGGIFGTSRLTKNPLDESFFEMLQYNVFPNLQWYSFSVVLCIILLVVFIVQISVDKLTVVLLQKDFLPVNLNGPFTSSMITDYDKIKQGIEIWRFISSLIVHKNAMQLFSSIVSLLIWTSLFERLVTWYRIPIYFVVGGFVGNVFANVIQGKGGVFLGASTGIFAIFGAVLGYLIYNWKNMSNSPNRLMWMFSIIFIVLFSFLFSGLNEGFIEHLTGFVSGFFVGLAFYEKYLDKNAVDFGMTRYETVFFLIGVSMLGILLMVPLFVVYLF